MVSLSDRRLPFNRKFFFFFYLFVNFLAGRFLGVLIKLLPCVMLTVISCRLIQALYKVNKRKQALRGHNSNNMREESTCNRILRAERKTDRTTRMLVAILMLFLITEFPQGKDICILECFLILPSPSPLVCFFFLL